MDSLRTSPTNSANISKEVVTKFVVEIDHHHVATRSFRRILAQILLGRRFSTRATYVPIHDRYHGFIKILDVRSFLSATTSLVIAWSGCFCKFKQILPSLTAKLRVEG